MDPHYGKPFTSKPQHPQFMFSSDQRIHSKRSSFYSTACVLVAVLDVLVAVLFAFVSNHPRSPSGFHTNYRSKVPTRNDENIRMHLKSSILKRRPTALTSSRRAIRFIWRSSGWEVANPGRTINVFRREEIIFLEK